MDSRVLLLLYYFIPTVGCVKRESLCMCVLSVVCGVGTFNIILHWLCTKFDKLY